MTTRALLILGAILAGSMAGLGAPGASAQTSRSSKDVQSTFEIVEAPVLKVFLAEEEGHRFVAYLVKWKSFEVIVSDPLAASHLRVGDKIRFMAQKMSLPGLPRGVSTLCFQLLEEPIPPASPAEQEHLMKIAQGDLHAAKNETERFYALNRAAKRALKEGQAEKALALATELERLAPKFRDDWNYGNAVQDANQVLGRIALSKGDVAEAKKRLISSAESKGSPQMNSFGPNLQLAKALLEKGEKDVVLEYFKRCSTFWKMGEDRLAAWTASVRKGEMPEFGANLDY